MKIGICVRAIQTDGNSSTAFVLADTLQDAGHDVTLLSPVPGQIDRGRSLIDIGQTRWESNAALVRRLGRTFAEQQFDVVMVLTGLPIPRLEEAYRLLPDSTALVPVILGDREHVYEPAQRTARLWNVAVTISPGLAQEVKRRVPDRPVRMLTHAIDLPDPARVANRATLGTPIRLISVGRLFGRKNVLVMPPILAECGRRGVDVTLTIVGEGPDRVLLEAQANGCVPVATRLPGISDYAIAEGETGLLAPEGGAVAFAEQIVTLADADRWRSLSVAGIERTRRLFSREVMARELATLLEQIGAGRYPTPTARRTMPQPQRGWRAHVPPALRWAVKHVPFV